MDTQIKYLEMRTILKKNGEFSRLSWILLRYYLGMEMIAIIINFSYIFLDKTQAKTYLISLN